jgi:hypothetical protein
MVGEIRDKETAEIAIHASLTGHLVLSTLHTNDAAGAITRLGRDGRRALPHHELAPRRDRAAPRPPPLPALQDQDFRQLGVDRGRLKQLLTMSGVQPWPGMPHEFESPAAASSGNGHEAPAAKSADFFPDLSDELEPVEAEPTQVRGLAELAPRAPAPSPLAREVRPVGGPAWGKSAPVEPGGIFYRAVGCEECGGTGYRGRIAIAEILILDDAVRREILNRSDANHIAKVAIARGMRTLREDGARVVTQGMTSLEEVLAATQAGEME